MIPGWIAVLLVVLFLSASPATGSPLDPRPVAGKGILIIPPRQQPCMVLYEFPGVRRIGTFDGDRSPSLTNHFARKDGGSILAVSAVRGGWARVACDDTGREGWLEIRRGWRYFPWERFLAGVMVRVVPGQKESAYRVRSAPGETYPQSAMVTPGFPLHVVQVRDDWVEVLTAGQPLGWLRWRDGDGRLLVTVE